MFVTAGFIFRTYAHVSGNQAYVIRLRLLVRIIEC